MLDRVCADLESKDNAHFTQDFFTKGIIEDRLAIIDGITKRRSCSGIRIAFVLGSSVLMDYIDYCNETMIFYPPFLGIKIMIVEYLFQAIVKQMDHEKQSSEIALENTIIAIAELAEKISQEGKFREIIGEIISIPHENFNIYMRETKNVKKIILENQTFFVAQLKDFLVSATNIQSGFSFAVMFKNEKGLTQEYFCGDIYKNVGVHLYPDVYFGNLQHEIDHKFWVRIGCALPKNVFCEGVKRLCNYFKE